MSTATANPSDLNPQQQAEVNSIITTYKGMRAEISELANKVSELDSERSEHQLVIRAIADLDPNRKCYRSIGGVLVERTVAEVLPAVNKNLTQLDELINRITTDLKAKETATDEFRLKHNIQMGQVPTDADADTDSGESQQRQSSGVLA